MNVDAQLSSRDMIGMDLFIYCGNNPVNRFDPTGEDWWHWVLEGAIVVASAVAVVVTAGGAIPGLAAIGAVASGYTAATTASTVAATAFVGSSLAYGTAVIAASSSSNSASEFASQGGWGTVAATISGGLIGALSAYVTTLNSSGTATSSNTISGTPNHTTGYGNPQKPSSINPGGSYTQITPSGQIRSYAQYNMAGRQTMRIDFEKPHAGVVPHIHLFIYPERGNTVEYIFDLQLHLIN